MRRAAGADGAERGRVRPRLQPGDQFGRGLRRQIVLADDPQRRGGQQRDRLQILEDVVVERVDRRRADMARPIADADHIAVWAGVDDSSARNRAAGAADGFDDHALAERRLHRIGQDARQRVGRAAGRKADQHGDRAGRIGLRQRCRGKCQQHDQPADQTFHGNPLGVFPIITMTRTPAALKMRKRHRDEAPRDSPSKSSPACGEGLRGGGTSIDASHISPVTIRKCLHFSNDS